MNLLDLLIRILQFFLIVFLGIATVSAGVCGAGALATSLTAHNESERSFVLTVGGIGLVLAVFSGCLAYLLWQNLTRRR